MKPVKVLHVHEVEKEAFYFSNLADYTDRDEFELSFVSFAPAGDFSRSMEDRGLKVYSLDPINGERFLRSAKDLWSVFRKEDPDIVHTHLLNPTVLGLNLAKWYGRKSVLTRHHSDALHKLPSKFKRQFYLGLERRNNRLASHIIAPARMVRDCIVDLEGTQSEKVSVIPYGQTAQRFDAITPEVVELTRSSLGMDKQLSLVCVSRLFRRKGHDYLFEAIARLAENGKDLKVYLVGSGEYRSELEQKARDLKIVDQVEFLGFRDDVLSIIASADIIVHPSLEDALSQSLIESLMLGRPIVATNISGAGDILDDGKYGRLVRPADAEDFRRGLLETIENRPAAQKNAAGGREYLLKYMDAQRVTDEYATIYRRVLGL